MQLISRVLHPTCFAFRLAVMRAYSHIAAESSFVEKRSISSPWVLTAMAQRSFSSCEADPSFTEEFDDALPPATGTD